MAGQKEQLWKEYGKPMQTILNKFAKGTLFNISMHPNGLLWQGKKGMALTWMDAVVNGKPVTGRHGYAVEVNALWYNAIMFALELAEGAGDQRFIHKWEKWPEIIWNSFKSVFWDDQRGYLADHVNENGKNEDVRPNMLFAVSLPHSPVGPYIQAAVLQIVEQELLTSRGLRSLSPKNRQYKGTYFGDQKQRDLAYHQGTAWPWLLGAYADAFLRLHGKQDKDHIKSLYENFEEVMSEAGIGTISEIYDGDPPHVARGALSQAWNISELLRIKWILDHL